MTKLEAIEVLRSHKSHWERLLREQICDYKEGVDFINAVAIAINAINTIEVRPMQVELIADGYADGEPVYDYGECPKCGWEFEEDDKDWEKPFCCNCGQKLKWFESEANNERKRD